MSTRSLVAFYSLGGNSRVLANELRDALLCHIEEISEPRGRKGMTGVMRSVWDSVMRREPPLLPVSRDPARYDLLVLGGPVWVGRIAAPLRTYARQHGGRAAKVAFFCTQGGSDPGTAFAELETLCGRRPVATLSVRASDLARKLHKEALARFVAELAQPDKAHVPSPGDTATGNPQAR